MHVVFAVGDLARSVAFYETVFGWPRNERIDFAEYVELHPDEGGTLGLCERPTYGRLVGADAVQTNGDVSPAYLYVRLADPEAAAARIRDAGGRELAPFAARSWGEVAGWFADPDGNVVALARSQG
ncbi:MAG TPA: VOC family protein [Gaiellaceae bacterium]